jgi:hypothetical protein
MEMGSPLLWLLVILVAGLVVAAAIIDWYQKYDPYRIVKPRARAAPGVGGPPVQGAYIGFEMMVEGQKDDSREHYEEMEKKLERT